MPICGCIAVRFICGIPYLAGKEKLKITEMRIPSKGEIVRTEIAHAGEIVIVPCDSLRLNDVLGNKTAAAP